MHGCAARRLNSAVCFGHGFPMTRLPFPRNGNGAETGLDLSTDSGQIQIQIQIQIHLGSKYSAVQNRVNEILGATGASSTSMDVDAMARAAIRGDYGNGDERKRRLGSYYSIVQRRVNEMLS